MKILIIEDNDIKYALIVDFLKHSHPTIKFQRAGSYQSGIKILVRECFDLVILDMTLPISDINQNPVGMQFLPFGGQVILRECARKHIDTRFIILTQYSTFIRDKKEISFEQLREELLKEYPDYVRDCVRLDNSSINWKNNLSQAIQNENPNC